ncbi:amino acid adenylation domain-containing protein [Fulvivirgaceae bacterium PWU4]|uniref:Amino acid adenylation domain-containing protein n=1 Tax=Chryseosolibacter histidini TaxID=2782349 RepID=A0AAP2DFK7_9BACT|nr:non-ribosomal peptide synthetase [Chryseosolibacter histidini]MBT1695435.1 amino acid adenylation domain-containing protein [Chryseosolibacter histidini]
MNTKIDKSNVEDIVELNMAQQGMLFHYLRESEQSLYNVQLSFQIEGQLDVNKLRSAFSNVQARHEALRSVFRWEEANTPLQIILKSHPLDFTFEDFSQRYAVSEISGQVAAYLLNDRNSRFDLTRLPLRAGLIRISAATHVLFITHHHILYDGWSTAIFLKELFQYYGHVNGNIVQGFNGKIKYGDLLRQLHKAIDPVKASDYWKHYLSGHEIAPLVSGTVRTSAKKREVKKLGICDPTDAIETWARQHRVSKVSVIYAAYGLLLQKYLDTPDVVFGTVVSSRDMSVPGIDKVMGNFINTIPLRLTGDERSLKEIVKEVNRDLAARSEFSNVSYHEIKQMLGLKPAEDLFDSVVIVENYPIDENVLGANDEFQVSLKSVHENTGIPLTITVFFNQGVKVEFAYRDGDVADDFVKAFAGHFFAIIATIINNGESTAASLDILSETEKDQLLTGFNDTVLEYAKEKTIVELFQSQARRSSADVALSFNGQSLTYRELNGKANSLAAALRNKGVKPNQVVGLYTNRSLELYIGMLAVLKSGGCYLPLDPSYPKDRLAYMLADSGARVLLTTRDLSVADIDPGSMLTVITVDSGALGQAADLPIVNDAEDLAYLIYTSGSTGKPKGVMLPHRAVHNYIESMMRHLPAGGTMVSVTTFSFDIFVTESLLALTQGMRVVIADEACQKDAALLLALIEREKVELIQTTPSRYKLMIDDSEGFAKAMRGVRYLLVGGEAFQEDLLRSLKKYSRARIINVYGPTETTVWSSLIDLTEEDRITIGRPLGNTQLYVLDRHLHLQPRGAAGELYISGDGLAHGYWNNKALSDQRFISNPFRPGFKMYKTGDKARWTDSGTVEYLGRVDFQVKIRGHRIETGEIESLLKEHPQIKDAVVIAKASGNDTHLVAYYVCGEEIGNATLRSYLSGKLPDYMVPAYFVHLAALPLTPNRKLDRRSLPEPAISPQDGPVAPANATEERLVKIWSEILKIDSDRISVLASFFELGGHSLKATTLVNRIFREFDVRISINEVFTQPDIRSLATALQTRIATGFSPIQPAVSRDFYPLSAEQKRIYFSYAFDRSSLAYNGIFTVVLEGTLDKALLEDTFTRLVARHETLRTCFEIINDVPVQRIRPQVELVMEHFQADEEQVSAIMHGFVRPFDLQTAPLMRTALIEIAPDRHVLIVDIHHIVCDGISQEILTREFMAMYDNQALPDLRVQYKDYAVWQQEEKRELVAVRQREFWTSMFADMPEVLTLPYDFSRPVTQDHRGGAIDFRVGAAEANALRAIAAREGATLFMVTLAIYNILLSRLAGSDDIVVGTAIAGREHPDLEHVVGMFVNTIPVRNHPAHQHTFTEFLSAVKSTTLSCFEHQAFPYDELLSALKVERHSGRNPLFDIMFAYQSFKEAELQIPGLRLTPFSGEQRLAKFDLALLAYEKGEELLFTFEYAVALFNAETIARWAVYFKNIVSAIVAGPDKKIADIGMLPDDEVRRVMDDFNNTGTDYPLNETIISLFEKQVKKTPENIALRCGNNIVTYAALERKANAVATAITMKLPEGNGHKVGLLFDSSVEMIAGMLGVLKAGCAYVPLSPQTPGERNSFILADSEAALLLTQRSVYMQYGGQTLSGAGRTVVFVESCLEGEVVDLQKSIRPDDLMYVIYTSGTTGQPKGVAIKHQGIVNFAQWRITTYAFTERDVTLQLFPYHFDGFGANLYPSLLTGGTLMLLRETERLNAEHIAHVVRSEKITNAVVTPLIYDILLRELNGQACESLRLIVLAGEKAAPELIERSGRLLPGTVCCNEYGPTETSIGATWNDNLCADNVNVIGKPIANTRIYILGKGDVLIPVGACGELCIAGAGLAQGYIRNESLTSAKFCDHPFIAGERMYRTGDLARWRDDGSIVLIGRIDSQVKIRGFRIEPGEIEGQLSKYPLIREVIVNARDTGNNKYLVAYYVADQEISFTELRNFLLSRLPDYMVPACFVHVQKMPLTANGKIDTKALPVPVMKTGEALPTTGEERLLVEVWASVLGMENIGVTDNFFAAGGDSIKSIQICSRMRSLGYDVAVKDIFTHQTIQQLAPQLKTVAQYADQRPVTGPVPLTPVQQWFFDNRLKHTHHFNQAVMLRFEGGITEEVVHGIFEELQRHHDALRMVFTQSADEVVQTNRDVDLPVSLQVIHLQQETGWHETLLEYAGALQRSIDLENGPLMKLALFHLANESRLLIVIHHLVIDGVSWRILFEDIESLYAQVKGNLPLSLPPKTDSFQSWSKALRSYVQGTAFQRASAYWHTVAGEAGAVITRDFPAGRNTRESEAVETISFSVDDTARLLGEVHRPFNTGITDILLTALMLAFREMYGNTRLWIELEGHGRHDVVRDVNISRTVGWFTSIYPVLLDAGSGDWRAAIKQVKETLRKVPHGGIDYLLVKHAAGTSLQAFPAPQVSFNYLGQFDADMKNAAYTVSLDLTGNNISDKETRFHDWEISGMLVDGRLALKIAYSHAQYTTGTMHAFADHYRRQLVSLIGCCSTYGATELTPSDVTYKDLPASTLETLQQQYQLEDVYPLSPMQEGILFHSLLDADADSYFAQMTLVLEGDVDIEAVEKTMNDIVSRYATLRTAFYYQGQDRALQLVLKDRKATFHYRDLQEECAVNGIESTIAVCQEKDRHNRFDLRNDCLIRASLFCVAPSKFVLILSHHHIIMDGWCMDILLRDFRKFYADNRMRRDMPVTLAPRYARYIDWLESREAQSSVVYWKDYLRDYETPASLPAKVRYRESIQRTAYGSQLLVIDRMKTVQLGKVSAAHGVTLNTVLQTAWGILLAKYNNVTDCVFGAVVSGRPSAIEGVETMVGLFINTIPVRVSYEAGDSIADMLRKIQHRALESEAHHYTKLAEIQSLSTPGNRLFDHIIVVENYPLSEKILKDASGSPEDLSITDVRIFDRTNYDLVVTMIPGEELRIRIDYSATIYDHELIKNVLAQLDQIITQVSADAGAKVAGLEITTENEKLRLLSWLNPHPTFFPEETVVSLFERQARITPEQTALVYHDSAITYRELNERSNRLARCLAGRGVESGKVVGLMIERSVDMIVAMIGILKAGGTYLPLDTAAPEKRILAMLNDSSASLLLADHDHAPTYEKHVATARIFNCGHCGYAGSDLGLSIPNTDVAYIIYTSGSTGKPKGVMVQHRSVANLIHSQKALFGINEKDRILQFSTISFDASVEQIWLALTSGASLVLIDHETMTDNVRFNEYLATKGVTHLHATPSFLERISLTKHPQLKRVIAGGEECKPSLARKFYVDYEFYNEYGPTETTVTSLVKRVDSREFEKDRIAIGTPINNTFVYILGRHAELLPLGATGELYVGGAGVAKGYLGDEALTGEKFITNPFMPGEKMYRTGDLARWRSDGDLEYCGRADAQVKLRGFRIEPGEIETRILEHTLVREAAVVIRESGDDRFLVAYYVAEGTVDEAMLNDFLRDRLPPYMLPARYLRLEQMPATPSGKLDKKALPDPAVAGEGEYVLPSGETEEALQQIWSEVLNIGQDMIGMNKSFFALGGHSLKAMTLVNRIRERFGVEVPLKEVFRHPDIAGLSGFIRDSKTSAHYKIEKVAVSPWYKLSSAQKRLYFLYEFNRQSLAYNVPYAVRIEGNLQTDRLIQVFKKLVARHESLRTSFEIVEGEPVQKVSATAELEIERFNAGTGDVGVLMEKFVRPFDLRHAPLLRVGLVACTPGENILIVDMHHIISDGVSHGLMIKDFVSCYHGEALPPVTTQYKDYAAWQQSESQQEAIRKQKEFWLNEFAEELPALNLPMDFSRPPVKDYAGSAMSFSLTLEETAGLRSIADAEGSTMFMVILSVYNILLTRLCNIEDIAVGTPSAGRQHPDLEQIIGMFVNTLVMRNQPKGELSFREFLSAVRSKTLACLENQAYQYEELIQELKVERDTARNPLFDVMFVFENSADVAFEMEGLKLQPFPNTHQVAKFDLLLKAIESADQVFFELQYATSLFREETVARFIAYFRNILSAVIANMDMKISAIAIMQEEERHQQLERFNDTDTVWPYEGTVLSLFEKQAARDGERVALKWHNETLTYGALKEMTTKVASYLREAHGVRTGDLVGLMLEREMLLLPCIYGIIKAGAAYVPIDPGYPDERIDAIAGNAAMKFFITRGRYRKVATKPGFTVIDLDEVEQAIVRQQVTELPEVRSNDLAYVIYTSGSTGTPKGVMIEHGALLNIILDLQQRYPLGAGDTYLLKTTFTFDVSVAEIFGWFLDGGCLSILPAGAEADPDAIAAVIARDQVTHINFVPSMFAVFIEMLKDSGVKRIESLRYIFLAGEALPASMVNAFNALRANASLENIYGPTEGTIYSSGYATRDLQENMRVPIGKPLSNIRLYIVDRYNNLLPLGVPGELCIGGAGLARGYLNNEAMTAEKFVRNPFRPGERMYRTGDLARWLPDGNVEYLGRIDTQVKMRGFRIELEEIENQLMAHAQVTKAAVVLREENGNQYLVAYYVSESPRESAALKDLLLEKLPVYMVPQYYVRLDDFPLTASGKLNRKALPAPVITTDETYAAPVGAVEKKLVAIWAQVLKMDPATISADSSFFALGGHSIMAVHLINMIRQQFSVGIELRKLFENPSIRRLAILIAGERRGKATKIARVEKKERYAASPAQERLFYQQLLNKSTLAYNVSGALEIRADISIDAVNHAFRLLIGRHESLRTRFLLSDESVVQEVSPDVVFNPVMLDETRYATVEEAFRDFVRPFDLGVQPLLRCALLKRREGHVLFIDIHHIICDGFSLNILMHDFRKLCHGESLEPVDLRYVDYSSWQRKQRGHMEAQRAYWMSQLAGEVPVLDLPVRTRKVAAIHPASKRILEIDDVHRRAMKRYAADSGISDFMFLLSGFFILLSRISGNTDIIIGTDVLGRTGAGLRNVVGTFINLLPLRMQLDPAITCRQFVQEVKACVLGAFDNQDFQFDQMVSLLNRDARMEENPIVQVHFAFANFFDAQEDDPHLRPLKISRDFTTQYEFKLEAVERNGKLNLDFVYSREMYDDLFIETLTEYYHNILKVVLTDDSIEIGNIALQDSLQMA